MKDFTKNYYSGIKGIYFFSILKTIVRIGALDSRDIQILDYGCGLGYLSKMLPGKVIGYDIIPSLSETNNWRNVRFDLVVANEVFYLFSARELINLLAEFKSINPHAEIIVAISRQGLLNNIFKYLFNEPDAHRGTKLAPKEERDILDSNLNLLKSASVFQLCDVYHMRFKAELRAGTGAPVMPAVYPATVSLRT